MNDDVGFNLFLLFDIDTHFWMEAFIVEAWDKTSKFNFVSGVWTLRFNKVNDRARTMEKKLADLGCILLNPPADTWFNCLIVENRKLAWTKFLKENILS